MMYADRKEAGQRLAEEVESRRYAAPLVLALPRGGVPVAREIATRIGGPLDTLVVRKIGAPLNPEWAVGAIASPDIVLFDEDAMRLASISKTAVEGVIERERAELERRMHAYRSGSYAVGFVPKTVIIVDDGIATGMTARAALRSARTQYPKARLVLASPVCLGGVSADLASSTDDLVCLSQPLDIYAIGAAYENFPQISDEEVNAFLKESKHNFDILRA